MRILIAASAAAALLGCTGSGAQRSPSAGVRDSAGVEIVEHAAGSEARLPQWVVPDSPLVDLGGRDEPGHDLHLVGGALRLGDGRLVIANRGTQDLRVFDSTGRFLSTIGRQGNGPGEFAALGGFQRHRGDSILVFDGQLRRASLFAPTGEFVRSLPTSVQLQDPRSYLGATAALGDGRLLGTSSTFKDMKETSGPVRRDTFAVVLLDRDGQIDTIVVVPGWERYPAVGHEGGQSFPTLRLLQFSRSTVYQTDGDRVYVGTNDPTGIQVYDGNGKLVRIIRTATPPDPVTEADRAQRIRDLEASLERQRAPSEQIKAEWRKNQENPRFAETFPYYERLLIGTDGTLWLERVRRFDDEGRRFLVYDSTGLAVATVSCPPRMRPYVVGPDRIIGLWRDPDEVHHVRVYPVRVRGRP